MTWVVRSKVNRAAVTRLGTTDHLRALESSDFLGLSGSWAVLNGLEYSQELGDQVVHRHFSLYCTWSCEPSCWQQFTPTIISFVLLVSFLWNLALWRHFMLFWFVP